MDQLLVIIYAQNSKRSNKFSSKRARLFGSYLHSTSYLVFTYYNRTFTNTIETILLSLLIFLIFDSCTKRIALKFLNLKIAAILTIGFFNRPTFAIFSFVPVIYWILTYHYEKTKLKFWQKIIKIAFNCLNLLQICIWFSIFLILLDSYYYEKFDLSITDFTHYSDFNVNISNLVITPWNFIGYNSKLLNLANHGLHPIYFHFLIFFPLMFTLLALILYFDWLKLLIRLIFNRNRKIFIAENLDNFQQSRSFQMNVILHLNILFSLIVFSLFPHQEQRFLLPLIIPLICLIAQRFENNLNTPRLIVTLWICTQLILAIFYGFIHQAGIIRALLYLKQNHYSELLDANVKTELTFVQMYLPPRHLLLLPNNSNLIINDYSVRPLVPNLSLTLEKFLNNSNFPSRMFIIIPTFYENLMKLILQEISKSYPTANVRLRLIKWIFPNFDGENLSDCLSVLTGNEFKLDGTLLDPAPFTINTLVKNLDQLLTQFKRSFGMSIWKIEI